MTSESNEQQFKHIVEDLSEEFAQVASREVVVGIVSELRAELEPAAKITDYLPVLVRRYSREALLERRRPLAV